MASPELCGQAQAENPFSPARGARSPVWPRSRGVEQGGWVGAVLFSGGFRLNRSEPGVFSEGLKFHIKKPRAGNRPPVTDQGKPPGQQSRGTPRSDERRGVEIREFRARGGQRSGPRASPAWGRTRKSGVSPFGAPSYDGFLRSARRLARPQGKVTGLFRGDSVCARTSIQKVPPIASRGTARNPSRTRATKQNQKARPRRVRHS